MNYQPEYYIALFENYGFQTYFKQHVLYRPLLEPMQARFAEKAEMVAKDPNYRFTTMKKNQIAKFAEDFRTILNGAWGGHAGFKPMRYAARIYAVEFDEPARLDGRPVQPEAALL